MNICIIGKFPPIQGGVSMRTYRVAHALAARGHAVHVVTNAKEASAPFRMHMRPGDWDECEARYTTGAVKVHWTERPDYSQHYLPMASAFVSKLTTLAANEHARHPFDVIYSHYLEPYGVAGHMAAQMLNVPHVVRTAGSDAGRLWHHPQLETLYDHILRSAEVVVATGSVAQRAIERGVDPARIAYGGQLALPADLFSPNGPTLDLAALRAEASQDPELADTWWGDFDGKGMHLGIYGKLGESKGSFALLDALHRLKCDGLDIGLVALAHGHPRIERRFRARVKKLGIADRVLQIPFLPPWRVPEFLRGCIAVCALEQDFPIGFHSPIMPFEVLLSGTCLVASTEVLAKLPGHGRLPHGYGCIAIRDVHDIDELSGRLAAIVADPAPASAIGARGRAFALELQKDTGFPETLEHILEAAAARRRPSSRPADKPVAPEPEDRFLLTRLAAATLRQLGHGAAMSSAADDLRVATETLLALRHRVAMGQTQLASLAAAVEIEVAVAEAEASDTKSAASEPLFRVRSRHWALDRKVIASLAPMRAPAVRLLAFDFDVSPFMGASSIESLPSAPTPERSYMVAFAGTGSEARPPLVIDRTTARILQQSDGARDMTSIAREFAAEGEEADVQRSIDWIEHLFLIGLLHLQDQHAGSGALGELA